MVLLAGFPVGYAAAAPAYTPSVYAGANPAFPSGKSRVHAHSLNTTTYLLFSSSDLKVPSLHQAMLRALLSKCPALPTQGLSHHTPPHPAPILLLFTRSGAPTRNRTPMHRFEHCCWLLVPILKCYPDLPEDGAVVKDHNSTSDIIVVSLFM